MTELIQDLTLAEAEYSLDDLRETVQAGIEEAEELLFAEAEKYMTQQARVLRRMAQAAYKNRRSKRALNIFTFSWMGVSAGNMARAVARRPEWFTNARNASTTEMRILFVLAQVDREIDDRFFEYWQTHKTLLPYEMQRMISAYRKRSAKPKDLKIKMRAQAIHVNREGKVASMELAADSEDLQEVVEGAKYKVNLAPDKP